MYYLRKLSKRTSLSKIKGVEDVYEIGADLLKQELSTTKNTLSFWKCIDLGNKKETMKAILLSTTSIEASQFIIVDDKLLILTIPKLDALDIRITPICMLIFVILLTIR